MYEDDIAICNGIVIIEMMNGIVSINLSSLKSLHCHLLSLIYFVYVTIKMGVGMNLGDSHPF